MAEQSGEKTEQPTDKKLEDSRKKGQVWKSRDLTGVMVFVAGLGLLKVLGPNFENELHKLFSWTFDVAGRSGPADRQVVESLGLGVRSLLMVSVPVAAGAAIVGVLVDFLQVGSVFAMEGVLPKMEKINPAQGFKNMFSKKQLVELVKSSAKIFAGTWVVYGVIRDGIGITVLSVRGDERLLLLVLGELLFQITLRIGLLYLVFAIFDVWWQRRVYMKELMMTKDEVKREFKDTEGDPNIKQRRKDLHQEILESIQMDSVRKADVVVTNPEHVAVALRYDRSKDLAPRVLAKGVDSRAQQIKALARESDVAMMRNVPLAHALLRVEVGQEIPESLYDAVAEVLNFVYSLRAQAAAESLGGKVRG